MPVPIGTNLPTIMQAVEQQLLTFTSAITTAPPAGNISNIYWIFDGDEPPPAQTGQRDFLLSERTDDTRGNVQGAGRFTWIYSGLDIYLRSSYAVDMRGTRKQWLIDNRAKVEGVMDALMGFFPVDSNQNGLTIEGFVLDTNAKPVKNGSSANWGEVVGTYRFHYLPKIDKAVIG